MRNQKLTNEQVQKMLDENSLEWLDGVYKNNGTPLNCRCKKCERHCSPTYCNLYKGKSGCKFCYYEKKKNPIEEVRNFLNSINLTWVDGIYKDCDTPLNCICKICKRECRLTLYYLKRNKNSCKFCSGMSQPSQDDIQILMAKNNLTWQDKVYKNNREPLNCVCNICDSICHPTYTHLQQGRGGCSLCRHEKAAKKMNNSCILSHWKTGKEVVCVGSFEKATVEYLNKNRVNYEWHSRCFETEILTPTGKKSFYTPDLYLPDQNLWIEIKGFFRDEESKLKWEWFHQTYPNSEIWFEEQLLQKGIL